MKTLYLDCPTGISGDMFLAALIDLGVDPDVILDEVRKLPVDRSEIDVKVGRAERHSITGATFSVRHTHAHAHRTFADIRAMIEGSDLAPGVRDLALRIFSRIAVAEGKVHGISADEVHFHEVGAIDSIIDIVGAAVAVTRVGVDRVVCSPLPLGSGTADTMHGRIPIPAPATLEILKGAPTAACGIPFELTTPTGAAIAVTLADEFGPMPPMKVIAVGYGAGKKDFREAANLLRAVVGEAGPGVVGPGGGGAGTEKLVMLETNMDDMTPQVAGHLMDRLFDAGALDAFYTPAQMKKNRPGVLLSVLVPPGRVDALLDVIFAESTTIGVRTYEVERHCLERTTVEVETCYGTVRVKVSSRAGRVVNRQPEYEDARKAALEHGVPLKEVIDAVRAAMAGDPTLR